MDTWKRRARFMTEDLLDKLKSTSAEDLTAGVAKVERSNGATLEPIYSKRSFKCFTVTESELQQLGLANISMTFTAAIGSALFAFWFDIFKDTEMATEIPDRAKIVLSYVKPLCLYGACLFWLFSLILFLWRGRMLSTIKKESKDL